jgi:hypothetical protein
MDECIPKILPGSEQPILIFICYNKYMKKIIISIVVVVVVFIGYWLISPLWRVRHVEEAAPIVLQHNDVVTTSESTLNMPSGTFVNGVHDVSGKVRVINTGTDKVLRFENFKTLNGPDLHIYLATDNAAQDYVEVGLIKGTEGNINYNIPSGVDLTKYNHVLVWCKTFKVLFGSAELK